MKNINDELMQGLNLITDSCNDFLKKVEEDKIDIEVQYNYAKEFSGIIDFVHNQYVTDQEEISEFYDDFMSFCERCKEQTFFYANRLLFLDTLNVFLDSLLELTNPLPTIEMICPCCKTKSMHVLDKGSFSCPKCGANDEDRLIVTYLDKYGLRKAKEGTCMLQLVLSAAIPWWTKVLCNQVQCEIIDLSLMENLNDFGNNAECETQDIIILSCAKEYIQYIDIFCELKRILKPEGKLIFVLSDEDIIPPKISDMFCTHSFYGSDILSESFNDNYELYVFTKMEGVSLDMQEKIEFTENFLNNGPLVSVLLPSYNHEKFIGQAIESILNQTYKNIELLVADDASTDNSVNVIKEYENRIKTAFYFKENRAGALPFLRGKATGKYVAVMHSDDIWDSAKIAMQVKYMEEHPETGACFTWALVVNEDLTEQPEMLFLQPNRSSTQWMNYFWYHGNALCHPSLLIQREIYDELPVMAHRQLPDFFMWVELIQKSSIYVMPRVLTYLRQHDTGENQNTSAKSNENQKRLQIEFNASWYEVILNMSDSFFLRTFQNELQNANATTHEEVIAEKYFLFLNSEFEFIRENAVRYFLLVYKEPKVRECFLNVYHYSRNDFWQDMIG